MINKTYREKGHAVFLSAIMILSMVAAGAVLTGSAAAVGSVSDQQVAQDGEVTVTLTPDSTDNTLAIQGETDGWTVESTTPSGLSVNPQAGTELDPEGGEDDTISTFGNYDNGQFSVTLSPPSGAGEGDTFQFDVQEVNNGNTVDTGTFNISIASSSVSTTLPDGETFVPQVASGDSINQDVVVTNDGDQTATEEVSLSVVNTTTGDTVAQDSQTVENLAAGDSETISLSTLVDATPGSYEIVLAVGGTTQQTESLTITDPQNTAAITGNVRTLGGELPQNVEEIDIRVFQDGSEVGNSPVNPDSDGEYTIEVPVESGGSSYSVEVDNPRFVDFSRTTDVDPQSTQRIDIRLNSDLQPNKVGVALWDSEEEQVIGDAAALLADGEFDGPVEMVVYSQAQDLDTQPAPAAPTDTTASVSADDLDGFADIFDAGQGPFLDPNDDEASVDDLTVTLNDGTVSADAVDTDVPDTATDGDTEFDEDGEVAYGTFNVTAGDVTKDEVEEFADAVAQGNIEATVDDAPITDTADLTYFVEGEKSTQHQVLDTDGEPIEDANVWVSYAGAPQNYDDVQEFQNDAGESFLTATTDSDGTAVIPGLVPEVNYHVYVQSGGFNIFNSSEAAAQGASDLTAATGIEQDTFVADYTLFETINAGTDGAGADKVYAHTLRQTPQDIALDVTVADDTGTQVKSTDVPDGNVREVQVAVTGGGIGQPVSTFDPLGGQTVTLELTNDIAGDFVNADDDGEIQVETNEDGVATAEFEATLDDTETTNVTASTQNAQGDVYETDNDPAIGQGVNDDSNQAEINVFTTGSLTGDVLDRNQDPIEGADVTLERQTADGDYVDTGDTDTTTASGQYVFQDLSTQENYRVTAEFEGDSGFATVDDLRAGTNTRDVVIEEAIAPTDPNPDPAPGTDLSRFDTDGDGVIDREEAVDAVIAYNTDGTVGDQTVSRNNAVDVIIAYNTGQSVDA